MQVKISELTGLALDWAVMTLEKPKNNLEWFIKYHDADTFAYSTNWAQGGPIIERETIKFDYGYGFRSNLWFAEKHQCYAMGRNTKSQQYGETPLIAAMRCYVASKLGDVIDIPDELMEVTK